MLCPECKSSQFKTESFAYNFGDECGIDGIVIESATRYECLKCSNVIVDLGQISEIETQLCTQLAATTGLLGWNQAAFLRKRLFKMTIDEFSELLGIPEVAITQTELNQLNYNQELSDLIRVTSVKKLISPANTKVSLGSELLTLFPKKR